MWHLPSITIHSTLVESVGGNRASVQSDEDEPESEEDESNPYPLDGIYKDELDRQR